MKPILGRIPQTAPAVALALAALLATVTPAHAQFGYGYPGFGSGGIGYGGYGNGGIGYGGYGSGGIGYGGIGYGGYGPGGLANPYGLIPSGFGVTGPAGILNPGIGYPGIGGTNPYFSFGLSPLAVQNVRFERTLQGRTAANDRVSIRGSDGVGPPAVGPVGTGAFGPR